MRKQLLLGQIERLDSSLRAYRDAFDRIFSSPIVGPSEGKRYFFNLLLCATQLYLASLQVLDAISRGEIHTVRSARIGNRDLYGIEREVALRDQFRTRLRSLPCWNHFDPRIPFSDLTGLRTLDDYLDSFSLHLPEIYEETLRVEKYTKTLISGATDSALAAVTVGLEHLAYNHLSFVLMALQWAANDATWRD